MRVFVSYAREDTAVATALVRGLQLMGHEPWIDDSLQGGVDWWYTILEAIRQSDALLAVLSLQYLNSAAAAAERDYARQLRLTILPVLAEPIDSELLPADLASIQFVDYTRFDADAAFKLSAALGRIHRSVALPAPLPAPPPVPISYLSDLATRARAATLTLDEQLSLVERLRIASTRPSEQSAALALLRELYTRHDLYSVVGKNIEAAIAAGRATSTDSRGSPRARTWKLDPGEQWSAEVMPMPPLRFPGIQWSVAVDLSVERHVVAYLRARNLARPAVLLIDQLKVWSSFKEDRKGLAKTAFPVTDGTEMRSVRVAGPWQTTAGAIAHGTAEIWVDDVRLLTFRVA